MSIRAKSAQSYPEAIRAASIGIVPLPTNGSIKGERASQPEAFIIAAAKVSRRGAFVTATLEVLIYGRVMLIPVSSLMQMSTRRI
jgi:hypothetical protein